jgi:NADPH:quinone reductase-like Zn-dependent oxidoreductase
VGSDVLGVAVGDRVAVMPQNSCMATHVVVSVAPSSTLPAEGLGTAGAEIVKIRRDVAPLDAISSVLTGVTAYQMLHRASGGRLTPDATILVHGCTGGTGGMLVALAKIAGITHIYGTCGARNVEAARANGIIAFDYKRDWAAEIRAHLTSAVGAAAGFNLIFDAVVTGGYFQKDTSLLQRGGKVILYGFTSTNAPGSLALPSIIYNFMNIWVQQSVFAWFSGREAEFYNIAVRRATLPLDFMVDLRAVLDLIASGRLNQVEGTRVWPFTQAKEQLIDVTRDV